MLDRVFRGRAAAKGARGFCGADPGSAAITLAGCLIGLASLLLPWGSVIVRDDTHATASITSLGMGDLLTSSFAAIVIASIIFIAATVLSLIDGRAVVGQVAALAVLFATIPGMLADILYKLSPMPPGWSGTTVIALGFYLGVLSAAVLIIPFLRDRRQARHEAQSGHAESHYRPEDLR